MKETKRTKLYSTQSSIILMVKEDHCSALASCIQGTSFSEWCQWARGCCATVQLGKPSKHFQSHALHPVKHLPVLSLLNYTLTFAPLLHVPWEYLKRVDGHQIQSKVCSAILLGKSGWLSPPICSPLYHQALYLTQLHAAFDNGADKLCGWLNWKCEG